MPTLQIMKEEKWEWYKDQEGRYKISSFGRLLSYCKIEGGRLRKGIPAVGYLQVQLWVDNRMVSRKIHRMVAETFIPNPENKPEVNHKDGNKFNNNVDNLEWCTPSENRLHSYRVLGKKNNLEKQKGETHYKAKLKIVDIIKIRELFKEGKTAKEIGVIFNNNPKNIRKIVSRTTWKHI